LKRCGGLGDILAGLTGLYGFWAHNSESLNSEMRTMVGCMLSCIITRRASKDAFDKYKYSLTASDVIEFISNNIN